MNETTQNNGARYLVGIDLGTTHCVLSYIDLNRSDGDNVAQDVMSIPQLTAPGVVDENKQLPSFLYQAGRRQTHIKLKRSQPGRSPAAFGLVAARGPFC